MEKPLCGEAAVWRSRFLSALARQSVAVGCATCSGRDERHGFGPRGHLKTIELNRILKTYEAGQVVFDSCNENLMNCRVCQYMKKERRKEHPQN